MFSPFGENRSILQAMPTSSHKLIQKIDYAIFNHLQTRLVWVYEDEVLPINLHLDSFIPEQTAIYILSGGGTFSDGNGVAEVREGEWIFLSPGRRHHDFSEGSRILSLHFALCWPGGQLLYDGHAPLVLKGEENPRLYLQAQRLNRLVESKFPQALTRLRSFKGDLKTHLRIHQKFLAWLSVYLQAMEQCGLIPSRFGRIDPRALQAVKTIDQYPFDKAFHGRELAQTLGLSVSQLDRLFIKTFGKTPRGYLEERKLRAAIERLRSSSEPIKQIAFEMGFRSLSHFSTWLRRLTQYSPKEIRLHRGWRIP